MPARPAGALRLGACARCDDEAVIDQLRTAVEALNQGDPEPYASLFADESEWRGVSHGMLWWKRTPSCHGSAEARATLELQLRKRGAAPIVLNPQFEQVGDRVIGSAQWLAPDGRRVERFQVLTIRDGKIVDVQGCRSRREAERFAHEH